MIQWMFSADVFLFAVNCAVASVVVCLFGILATRSVRVAGPLIQHNILLTVCLIVLLLPVSQYFLSTQEIAILRIDRAQIGINSHSAMWLVCGIWMLGTSVLLARFVFGFLILSCLRRTLVIANDDRLSRLMDKATARIGLQAPVRISTTRLKLGPMVVGIRDPVIVLPLELCDILTNEQLLCVLVHECEHVRRRDVLTATFQQFTSCFYWWNPCYLLAARGMEGLRERACDDRVAMLPNGTRDYATGLMAVAQWSTQTSKVHGPMLALITGQHDLINRIRRLRSRPQRQNYIVGRPVIPASAALLLIAIVGNMPFVGSGLAPAIVTQPQNYEKVTDVSQLLADERLMYLRIDTPGATTGNEIASFVTEYRTATIRGVIVDLRGKANVQYDEFEEQLARETPSNHEQLDAKSSAPLVVLLVDAETTTTTNVQAVLADSDLPAVILSRDHATTDHREFVPFQQTVFGHANDMQLQQAINMLTHV